MNHYWSAIQGRVCQKCIDGDGSGGCRLPLDQSCPVLEFLPQIVQSVTNTRSDRYDDYVDALRKNVCARCKEQAPEGVCLRRNSVECALDRYYGLILQVIEETQPEVTTFQA